MLSGSSERMDREKVVWAEKILSGCHVRVIKHKSYDAQQKRIK
jgi:hypothetical protein